MSTISYILSATSTSSLKKFINIFAELAKLRITLFVALSTSVGYIMQKGVIDAGMILSSLGVFLLASGSSSINHIQEKDYDKNMSRTKNRPIPSGDISVFGAGIFAFILLLSGAVILYTLFGFTALILGVISLVWYNFIYTPLKLKNAFAVIPGSLIGALPPVIGWVSAGGEVGDFRIISLAMFYFIWQIPHFWLLLMMYSDQYEKAGFPVLTKIFNETQLMRITFIWIAALVCSAVFIPLYTSHNKPYSLICIFLMGVFIILKSAGILNNFSSNRKIVRGLFVLINLYVLMVSVLLSVDKLLF